MRLRKFVLVEDYFAVLHSRWAKKSFTGERIKQRREVPLAYQLI